MKILQQKIKNLFNKESDFELGYEVAKEEYTSYYQDISINMGDDLFNFTQHLAEQFGEDYVQKTEFFIEKSVYLKEEMPPYLIVDPDLAERLKKSQPDDYRLIHFVKMMTEIYMCWAEPNKIEIAKAYCKFGLCFLDEGESYYPVYSKIFLEYKNEIMDREWDRN